MPEKVDFQDFVRQFGEVINRLLGRTAQPNRGENLPDLAPESESVQLESDQRQQPEVPDVDDTDSQQQQDLVTPAETQTSAPEEIEPATVPDAGETAESELDESIAAPISEDEFGSAAFTVSHDFSQYLPDEIEEVPELFVPFESDESKRLLDQSRGDEREGEQFSNLEQLLEFQGNQQNSSRRMVSSITKFFEQAAVDNHRDNQELERVVEMFLESRDTLTDTSL